MEAKEVANIVSTAKEYYWPHFAHDASWFDLSTSIIASAEGPYMVDLQGNRLLDVSSAGGPYILGANHPEVMEAMFKQLKKVPGPCAPSFASTPALILLAEKLASISPGNMKYTIFSSNGTDANETAIKIARNYWKLKGQGSKYKIIGRTRGYHGISLGTSAVSGHIFRRTPFEPLMGGVFHISAPFCYRCPYNMIHPECGMQCAQELRRTIEFEHPSTVACFIAEPTIGGGGVIPPPPGYMKMVRGICDEYDVLMICDEVINGFGRSGYWFDSEKQGVVPDMLTMGKGIAAGCGPLAGTHVKPEIYEPFAGTKVLQHGYTYGGMGYLAAAGLAGIEYIENNNLLARVRDLEPKIRKELEMIQNDSPIVGDVRVNGTMVALELVKDKKTKDQFPANEPYQGNLAVCQLAGQVGFQNGVLMMCSPWYGNIFLYLLPLNIKDEELDKIFNTTAIVLREIEKKFL
ncbi:MAG: aminotransferase class III-fold pyridoxal phosphate-dependent enzyme [Desulfatiglandales bacterium]